ncbi:MAG: hypothetical protein M3310_01895, partial [Actinomycetota bacterium]|nr:hypothetical protein [Actinomycetota bacterium]
MDDRRPRSDTARVGEELDRPDPVLGKTFLDLARLLVGVDVEHELLAVCVAPDLLEPVARAGADGVGGTAHDRPRLAKLVELAKVGRNRRLPKARAPASGVGGQEQHDLYRCLGGGLDRRP